MQLTRDEIMERLKDIMISAGGGNEQIYRECTEDSDLSADLGLSSIGMLYIVIAVEETFRIRFTGVGMSDFRTVKDVIDYIEEHQE